MEAQKEGRTSPTPVRSDGEALYDLRDPPPPPPKPPPRPPKIFRNKHVLFKVTTGTSPGYAVFKAPYVPVTPSAGLTCRHNKIPYGTPGVGKRCGVGGPPTLYGRLGRKSPAKN